MPIYNTCRKSPFVSMCFVDSGDKGDEAQRAGFEVSCISVAASNAGTDHGFFVLPKCRVVERKFGWINFARRLAKDFGATIESPLARLLIALPRRLTRLTYYCACVSGQRLSPLSRCPLRPDDAHSLSCKVVFRWTAAARVVASPLFPLSLLQRIRSDRAPAVPLADRSSQDESRDGTSDARNGGRRRRLMSCGGAVRAGQQTGA
jgi:hypothetical protein